MNNYKLSTRACMLEEKKHAIAPPRECPAPSLFETQQSPFTVESFLFSCRSSNFVLTNYTLSF